MLRKPFEIKCDAYNRSKFIENFYHNSETVSGGSAEKVLETPDRCIYTLILFYCSSAKLRDVNDLIVFVPTAL